MDEEEDQEWEEFRKDQERRNEDIRKQLALLEINTKLSNIYLRMQPEVIAKKAGLNHRLQDSLDEYVEVREQIVENRMGLDQKVLKEMTDGVDKMIEVLKAAVK